MTTPNFESILDAAPTEVKVPPPLPVGTYLWIVGTPEYGTSTKKGTPFVKFPLRCVAAGADVDETELTEVGGLEGKGAAITFWLTEDAVFMLDRFHENCGLNLADAASRRARNDEVVNAEIMGHVKHQMSGDGQRTYIEIDSTAPAE